MYSHDLNVHCEICAYSRFCETKKLKGENNSVLHSLFSLPPTTYWWASSCILGNQWLKRFHRVSAWLRVIWQIYELCWTGSKCPENNRHFARCVFLDQTKARELTFFIHFFTFIFCKEIPGDKNSNTGKSWEENLAPLYTTDLQKKILTQSPPRLKGKWSAPKSHLTLPKIQSNVLL